MSEAAEKSRRVQCVICARECSPAAGCVSAGALRLSLAAFIQQRHPESWRSDGYLCWPCLSSERTAHLIEQLAHDRGELSAVEADVSRKAAQHSVIAAHIGEQFERDLTVGQRLADTVARAGGSWPFVIGFVVILAGWIGVNSLALHRHPFDPYPYILLNLVLSCVAAVQAPVIMMAQNRSAARDRLEADEDFKVNLKAELEIAALHEKIDHLIHVQWDRMVELQETQLEVLAELASRGS